MHGGKRALEIIDGVYVPSLYVPEYDGQRLVSVQPRYDWVPPVVEKRTISVDRGKFGVELVHRRWLARIAVSVRG